MPKIKQTQVDGTKGRAARLAGLRRKIARARQRGTQLVKTPCLYELRPLLPPFASRYKPFRDKHAAHRAIDFPRKEDTAQAKANYAWALSSFGAMGFAPKPPQKGLPHPADHPNLWRDSYFELQLWGGDNPDTAVNFSLERDHPVISNEAYSILEAVLTAA